MNRQRNDPLNPPLSESAAQEQAIAAAAEVNAWRHAQESILKKLNDLDLRKWCVEQAIKNVRPEDDCVMLAEAILKFVSTPFHDILKKGEP